MSLIGKPILRPRMKPKLKDLLDRGCVIGVVADDANDRNK